MLIKMTENAHGQFVDLQLHLFCMKDSARFLEKWLYRGNICKRMEEIIGYMTAGICPKRLCSFLRGAYRHGNSVGAVNLYKDSVKLQIAH